MSRPHYIGWSVSVVLVLLWASVAVAQEGGGETPQPAATAGDGNGNANTVVTERDRNLYWGGRRDVSIVQKRLFTKDGRIELTVFGGVIPNDPFLTYIPFGGRVGYYFVESIGIELTGSFSGGVFQVESGLAEFLRNDEDISAEVTLLDKQQWRGNGVVVWSPFYGKFALLDARLSNFDVFLAAGVGALGVESPDTDDQGRATTASEIEIEGILGAGTRFFVTDSLAVRLDYRQGIFQKAGGGVATPSEISLGVSFFFGGGE